MAQLSKGERAGIAKGALAAAEQQAADNPRSSVASLEELLDMDQAELDAYLAERGTVVDWEALDHRVLEHMGNDGLALDRALASGSTLSAGRSDRIRASVEKSLVAVARESANQFMAAEEQDAMFAAVGGDPSEQFGIWISIGSGSCDDCISFHGTIMAMDQWEGIAPEDGVNQCGGRCRCRILPCADPGAGNEGLRAKS